MREQVCLRTIPRRPWWGYSRAARWPRPRSSRPPTTVRHGDGRCRGGRNRRTRLRYGGHRRDGSCQDARAPVEGNPDRRHPGWINLVTFTQANAALRNIVRRDTGEALSGGCWSALAQESGIKTTPTAEDLARLDRKRKGKISSRTSDWQFPGRDPEAKSGAIAKMKDGHHAHLKACQARARGSRIWTAGAVACKTLLLWRRLRHPGPTMAPTTNASQDPGGGRRHIDLEAAADVAPTAESLIRPNVSDR